MHASLCNIDPSMSISIDTTTYPKSNQFMHCSERGSLAFVLMRERGIYCFVWEGNGFDFLHLGLGDGRREVKL